MEKQSDRCLVRNVRSQIDPSARAGHSGSASATFWAEKRNQCSGNNVSSFVCPLSIPILLAQGNVHADLPADGVQRSVLFQILGESSRKTSLSPLHCPRDGYKEATLPYSRRQGLPGEGEHRCKGLIATPGQGLDSCSSELTPSAPRPPRVPTSRLQLRPRGLREPQGNTVKGPKSHKVRGETCHLLLWNLGWASSPQRGVGKDSAAATPGSVVPDAAAWMLSCQML